MLNINDEIQTGLTQLESTQPQLTKLEYLTLEIWKTIVSNGYLPTDAVDKAVEVANYMIRYIEEVNKECD